VQYIHVAFPGTDPQSVLRLVHSSIIMWLIANLCSPCNRKVGIKGCCNSITMQCNRMKQYSNVLRKDDSEWVKKCIDFVVEGLC